MVEVIRSPLGCTTEAPSPKTFSIWCSKNRVIWDKCTISVSAVTGRCVVAKQHIKKGEVLVEVPDSQVLMAENSQINQMLAEDGLVKPAEDALLEVQGLILAIMYEKALGKKSHWEPYLSFLPTDMSHMPIYWTGSELSELRGTAAYDKMMGRVQHPADAPTRMSQLFDELVLPFVQSQEAVCKLLLGKSANDVTEEEARDALWPRYQWATAVVASYSFVLGDDQYQGMVPVWDLLNHITGKINVRLHHDAEREVLQMIATRDIPEGAEVVNCYGQLSNAELLRGYGYVEQHNTIKHVQIPAQFLIRAAAAAAAAAAGDGTRKQQQNGGTEAAAAAAAADGVDGDRSEGGSDESADHEDHSDHSDYGSDHDQSSDHGDSSDPSDHNDLGSDLVGSSDHDEHDDASDQGDDDDGDSSEPDWDLEDDPSDDHMTITPKQQQQHIGAITLSVAQDRIHDWEDRWQLCYNLRLLPKNNIFQIPAGGVSAVQGNLLAVLLLLLADARDCEQLAAALMDANDKAAAAAAASKRPAGRKKGKQQQQQGPAADLAAAAAAEAVSELQSLQGLNQPSLLLQSLQLLVTLMLSRYTCTLQQDQKLLQKLQDLPPRLAAAVIARSGEKEVLHQVQKALQQPGISDQLIQTAREALTSALQQAVTAAAAAAAIDHCCTDHCCTVPGCSHQHHQHEREEDDNIQPHTSHTTKRVREHQNGVDAQQQQQQQQQEHCHGGKGHNGNRQRQQKVVGEGGMTAADAAPAAVVGGNKKRPKGKQQEAEQHAKQRKQDKGQQETGAAGFAFNFKM